MVCIVLKAGACVQYIMVYTYMYRCVGRHVPPNPRPAVYVGDCKKVLVGAMDTRRSRRQPRRPCRTAEPQTQISRCSRNIIAAALVLSSSAQSIPSSFQCSVLAAALVARVSCICAHHRTPRTAIASVLQSSWVGHCVLHGSLFVPALLPGHDSSAVELLSAALEVCSSRC